MRKEDNGYPANHGKPWLVEDMWKLSELYQEAITWHSIAQNMQRTISACQARMYVIRIAFALMDNKTGSTIMNTLVRRVKEDK
jgi:hypothetical protein